ncbi:MAG TPA: hypothetical protein VKA38_02830, partial [Draconibacterium sp.]|nr:hypothetical protein [Draconibacterium sp.]
HPGAYRYYRLEAPTWQLNIAELEFLTEEKTKETTAATLLPVFHEDSTPQKQFYKIGYQVISNSKDSVVFDGDMLTFSANKQIILDLGSPRKINRLRIAPRNAHNGIVRGDNYQLFYWNDEWISAGVQQAEVNYLEYKDVPAGTLYWLRNLDHGKEEQPFFYENGKQVFSNQPQIP